jgi:GT2 family glycosyltransferase/SAM-dependent methyltransferase
MNEPKLEFDRPHEQERRAWDAYYDSLPLREEDASTSQFNAEFVERISALLPAGGRVLEAGCGAGWQSVALARSGRFDVSALDFSPRALDYSRRIFACEGLSATWIDGDIRDKGEPAFDLVFSAGVLQHYPPEQQAAILRGMASRSRRYVLVLAPNALCYWYWLCRFHKAAGDRPFEKEVPLGDLSALFPLAGLQFCGQVFLGQALSEGFIGGLRGMDNALREQILEVHRSPVIPASQRSYLVAALGTVSAEDRPPAGWTSAPTAESQEAAELRALVADNLAARVGSEWRLRSERLQWESALKEERHNFEVFRRRTLASLQEFKSRFEKELSVYRSQRAWRIMLAMRKAYSLLTRPKLRFLYRGLQEFELTFPDVLTYLPDELPEPELNGDGPHPLHKENRQYDIVVLPIFDFELRFQRPQQLAVQFARAGHRVFWVSLSRRLPSSSRELYKCVQLRDNVWEVHLRAAPFDLYRGVLRPSQSTAMLAGLSRLYEDLSVTSSCVIVQFPAWRQIGLGLREQFDAKLVYDCMDDWHNWPTEPVPGHFSLSEEAKFVRETDILVVTSRELWDRHTAAGAEPKLIPNAADFEFFHNAPASLTPFDLPRPVIGYYGAIADWIDLELIVEVARSRPDYSFVMIGQVHLSDISALKALLNVHLLGEKPYRELPGYLRQFDVCTLPFRLNQLTRAVDPVKVYEYLSQGKPVVSVPLPELAPLSELLYFARGAEEFAAQIDRALDETDVSLSEKRIAFTSENTWGSRVQTLDAAIRALYPLVSILVVTYNTREYLGPFFDSIRRNTSYPSYEVVVVDNYSTDGSAEELRRYAEADPRIRVECLQHNLGFAGGNNFAARIAKGEYLVLQNPDTIVTAGWLERLIGALRKDPTIGVVAPVSNFSGNETKVNTQYRSLSQMERFAAERARKQRGQSIDIGVIPLFCGLISRKLWEEVGPLDDGFQVGMFEDDDFSVRVRKAGYRIVTAEDCFIHHFGNGSFSKLKSEESLRIFEQNKKRFESKWNVVWLGHKTRPGVSPISEETKIPLSEFFAEEGAGGA